MYTSPVNQVSGPLPVSSPFLVIFMGASYRRRAAGPSAGLTHPFVGGIDGRA
jgi:hypothetical protein